MAQNQSLPHFSQINLNTVEPQLNRLLKNNLKKIKVLLKRKTVFTWDNLIQPMEDLNDALDQFWSPIQHLNGVMNSLRLRKIVNACLPKLSDYQSQISQNELLFHALASIRRSTAFRAFNAAQKKTIENDLRDFKLNGVHLPKRKKTTFAVLSKALSQLSQRFEENVLDATMGWKKHVTDEKELAGMPEHALVSAKKCAEKEHQSGWIFTLEAPSYWPVMMYADSQSLRKEMYDAFVTRASDQGPCAHRWNNEVVMRRILEKRFALAKLLGFNHYAEYSLETKMVKNTKEALHFLNTLAKKTKPKAKKEFRELSQFASQQLGIKKLNAWDMAYASEKLSQAKYTLSQEALRPFFPEKKVITGLFHIIQKLYGASIQPIKQADVWHPDVTCFRVENAKKQLLAYLFFDLYARENKRAGAWMDECRTRRRLQNGAIQIPVAFVTCNFDTPIGNQPALWTHDNVVTLFHECGHALQHILTKIDIASVSGINGIPWDAVEVASQIFENWAWEKESIPLFSGHYQTQKPLPHHFLKKIHRVKRFQSALKTMRQLEFALFDFELHRQHDFTHIQTILNRVRKKVSVMPVPAWNRFQHSFSHIFGGSYAAGYYSYKWAEVMACDAFTLFQKNGIFDRKTSQQFKETFLESGGAVDPMDLFIAFRGRKPRVQAIIGSIT